MPLLEKGRQYKSEFNDKEKALNYAKMTKRMGMDDVKISKKGFLRKTFIVKYVYPGGEKIQDTLVYRAHPHWKKKR